MVVSEKQTDQSITAQDAGDSLKKQPETVKPFRLESKLKPYVVHLDFVLQVIILCFSTKVD